MKLNRYNDLNPDGRIVKGSWELLPNHEIGYRTDGLDEEFRLKAPIIAAEPDALVVAVTQRQNDQTLVTRTLKITGAWKADAKNRLVFEAERSVGKTDALIFRGAWKLNAGQEIVYTYQTEGRKAGPKRVHEILFRGYWEIAERRRLTYVLSADSDSAFRFRGAFQTDSILAKRGEIRFQIGVEVNGRPKRQTITLFGAWKIGRNFALSFELDRPGAADSVLHFGGDFGLVGTGKIGVNLRSEKGQPLGVELVLTRDIFNGDGQLFARLVRTVEETRVEAGGRMRF
jgi:hypothetical protein